MASTSNPITRNSSIELLRILAIIGVFYLHFYNPIIGRGITYCTNQTNEFVLRLFENQFTCSVNLFVLISSYFLSQSSKRDFLKPLFLLLQVIIFNIIIYLYLIVNGTIDFSFSQFFMKLLPQNWFVIIYVALYLISPYLNIVISSLDKINYIKFLLLIFFLFSIYPTFIDVLHQWTNSDVKGLSTIGMYGSQSGYTIVQFVLIYFIGGYISKYPIKLNKLKLLLFSASIVSLLIVWSYLDKMCGFSASANSSEYCNPLVIAEAIILFLLFINITIKSSIINRLSKACFTMYLLHTLTYQFMPINEIVNMHPVYMTLSIFAYGIATFIICYIIFIIYDFCLTPLYSYVRHKICRNVTI